jgi:mannosyltransferase
VPAGTMRDSSWTRPSVVAIVRWTEGYLLPGLVVMLAWTLHVYSLGRMSLWFDELGTLYYVYGDSIWLDTILKPLSLPAIPIPPFFFLIERVFSTTGYNEFVWRFPSALAATATVPLVYALGHSWFGRRIALLGAFFLAISPLHVRYAQEARSYAMLTFLSILSLYLFWRALGSRKARWWLAFVAVTTTNLYTHLFAAFPWCALSLFGGCLLLWRNRKSRFCFHQWHFLAATLAILLLLIPLLPYVWEGLASEKGLGTDTAPIAGSLGWNLDSLLAFLRLFGGESNAGAILYAVLFILGAAFLAWKRRDILVLTVTWIALPLIGLLSLPFAHRVLIRYFLFALPVYLMVTAYGLGSAIRHLEQWFGSSSRTAAKRLLTALGVTILPLGILVAASLPAIADRHSESRQNWRDATRLIQAMAQPGDTLYVLDERHSLGIKLYLELEEPNRSRNCPMPVRVLRYEPDTGFSLDEDDRGWLIYSFRSELVPGGFLDSLLEDHCVRSPVILQSLNLPEDSESIAPFSYVNLALVRLEPDPPGIDLCQPDGKDQFQAWLAAERELGMALVDVDISLGLYAYYCGDSEEAIERLSSSSGLAGRDNSAWFYLLLADAYRTAGMADEATAAYEKVLSLDADNKEARKWMLEHHP